VGALRGFDEPLAGNRALLTTNSRWPGWSLLLASSTPTGREPLLFPGMTPTPPSRGSH